FAVVEPNPTIVAAATSLRADLDPRDLRTGVVAGQRDAVLALDELARRRLELDRLPAFADLLGDLLLLVVVERERERAVDPRVDPHPHHAAARLFFGQRDEHRRL